MRQWMVDPKLLCQKHLLGEHVESHMFIGTLKKGKSLKGYIDKGLVEVHNIQKRHDILADEMKRRGMNHNSPLEEFPLYVSGVVDSKENLEELKRRCPYCLSRIQEELC
jgi:hypothetical protein